MKRLPVLAAVMALSLLSACQSEKVDPLKSPCVGLEGSPCGPKRMPAGNLSHWEMEQSQA